MIYIYANAKVQKNLRASYITKMREKIRIFPNFCSITKLAQKVIDFFIRNGDGLSTDTLSLGCRSENEIIHTKLGP